MFFATNALKLCEKKSLRSVRINQGKQQQGKQTNDCSLTYMSNTVTS